MRPAFGPLDVPLRRVSESAGKCDAPCAGKAPPPLRSEGGERAPLELGSFPPFVSALGRLVRVPGLVPLLVDLALILHDLGDVCAEDRRNAVPSSPRATVEL